MSKNDPQPDLPIEPGNGDGDPLIRPPRITSVSPIGGALAGGIDVTITGSGFQPEAEVFFGSNQSPEVRFVSSARVTAKSPPAAQTGSVDVRLVNPDGLTATRPGAFTYVTNAVSLHAEVLGIEPLTVIEDTESEITIRGRNLIAAYNEGIVALRGSSRVQITFSGSSSSTDEATGIDSLVLTVRVTATPPLEQHERKAIQVLASLRPGAATDGIFQTSRHMFTVLPRAVPVLLAFTANLDPSKPNLVMVAGRNLEGCSLDMGQGAVLHMQKGDDQTVAAIVSFPEDVPVPESAQLKLLDAAGSEAGQFAVSVAPSVEPSAAKSTPRDSATSDAAADIGISPGDGGEVNLTLTPFPGQQILGPTATDSVIFPARGESLSFFSFNFGDFYIRIFSRTFRIQLFNEVRLIPFFDNGVGNRLNNTPVLAQVGKLFRVRGMGLLVALHVELIIHIEIVLIIGFRYQISPFGLFNEFFNDYPFAIGSLVISIRFAILVEIDFIIAFVVALVLPGGALKELFSFHLTLNIDFSIDSNGHFHFGTRFKYRVNVIRLGPILHNLLPCNGRFQLAEENGQTVFTDSFGGQVSFYMPRSAGQCCIPWDFGLELIRFEDGGPEQMVQGRFRAEFCLNAAESNNQNRAIVVSDRTPRGFPPPLELDIQDTSTLKAMFRRVNPEGIPIGDDLVDVTEFGYQVEFYLSRPPDVVDPESLRQGTAWALMAGENVILPRLFKADVVIVETDEEAPSFWPGSVTGFDILSFLARGLLPAIRTDGGLPVQVQSQTDIAVAATLVFKDPTAPTAAERDKLNEAPTDFIIPGTVSPPSPQETVLKLERCEPFEDRPLQYFLAAKVTALPPGVSFPVKLKLKVNEVKMMVFAGTQPRAVTPLAGTRYLDGRPGVDDKDRFFSQLPPDQEVTIEFDALNKPKELFPITPHLKEDGSGSTRKLVPPGEKVTKRKVVLEAKMTATDASSANTPVTQPKPLKLAIHNDENYEEYRRVFTEVQNLFAGSDAKVITYRDFAKTFFGELVAAGAAPSAATLGQKGVALWSHAVKAVQESLVQGTQTPAPVVTLDDRLLYWARLLAIGALKAYYARKQGRTLDDTTLSEFEWPSRGLEQDGRISFPAAGRKAIVTGFDPFQLDIVINKTNPSGLAALWLNGKTIQSSQGNTLVRTAIFPVRYKEFDEGLVEKAVRSNLSSIALLMTVSQGRPDFYDVDRFAAKNRGGGLDNNNDSNTAPRNFPTTPPPNPDGPEFIESSLPYERVITRDIDTRHLPEPQTGPTFTNNAAFIVNQAYVGTQTDHAETSDIRAEETWKKHHDQPLPYVDAANTGEKSVVGSGGNYLSNEIFYRTARVRVTDRPALPSGHLHVPPLGGTIGNQPALGPGLVTAVERALQKFLNDKLQLRSLGDVAFPDTVINRPSAPLPLKAQNETAAVVEVASAEIDPPDGFTRLTTLPAQANPNSVFELLFTFTPTAATDYAGIVRVKDAAGTILFSAQLRGKGLPVPPPPVIVRFEPAAGEIGDPITIFGSNLANATEVRIGGGLVMVMSNTDTQIEAMVTFTARTGTVSVKTLSGTATTTDRFTVIRYPHHEPLSAQLIARRAELGLSASEGAARVGAKPGTYRRWESGEDRPSARFRPGIAGFLGHDPNPDPKIFGEIIRSVRERDGLTRSQLAERLGLASSTVKAWEEGAVSRPSTRVSSIFEGYVAEE
jgi:transcriptional regulator with XRE-family HTH domain/pyrrolidone-carboxylate peptidase